LLFLPAALCGAAPAVEPITIPREAKNAPLVAPAKQGSAKGGGE